MIAPEYFNNHIAVEGEIIVNGVPNDTGSVLVWNPVTKKISTRTHAEIVSDLSVMTTNTAQDIGGRKIFYVSGNSNPEDTTLWTYGAGGAKAGIVFYSAGMDAGKINFDGLFHLKNFNDTGHKGIVASEFRKANSDDSKVLLGGGGEKSISDFSANSHTHDYLFKDGAYLADVHGLFENNKFKFITRVDQSSANLFPSNLNSNSILSIASHDGDYGNLLGFNSENQMFVKSISGGNWSGWEQIAYKSWVASQLNNLTGNYVPFNGASQNVDLNSKNLSNVGHFQNSGSIISNNVALSAFAGSYGGYQSNPLIKIGARPGNMLTFTVKLYNYPYFFYEFQVNIYNYLGDVYEPTITWKAGDSAHIDRVEFYKDPATGVFYIRPIIEVAYSRIAITDVQAYGGDDTFLSSSWDVVWGGDVTPLLLQYTILSTNFNGDSRVVNTHKEQLINARKDFNGATGNDYLGAALQLRGNGPANTIFPTIAFHQYGLYAGTVSYRGDAQGFYFTDVNGSGFENITARGFYKYGSDNGKVLLGGGDHKPLSDFWTPNNFNPNSYIPTSHPVYGISSGEINEWRHFGGYWDNRNIQPAHLETQRLQMGFTNWFNNGDQASHYADYLHFGGYQDSSGGSQNLIMFSKAGPGIRQFQGSPQGVSPYKSYVDYWHTGNFTQSEIDRWNSVAANSSNFVSLHTEQTIISKKTFAGGDGNGYSGAPLMVNGNGNTDLVYPTISFHQPGLYAATVSYRGNGFYFMDIHGNNFDYVRAAGYIKDGSDNNYVLLGGGGHKAVSDFLTSSSLNDYLPRAGGTMTGMINFGNNVGGIMGQVGDNDYWRVYGNTAGSNQGYLEIATGDDGNEPIYIRQYGGLFTSLIRTATLLDESGNTNFPGTVYSQGFIKAHSDNSLILLGGGGHKAISDFALSSQLGSYVTSNTTQTIDATKTIGFQNTIYSGWDRSSVANPQMGPFSLLNLALQGAYPLYGDEEFRYGVNGIGVYNNYGNGTVSMTREAASDLPNRSGIQLRFNYNGNGATPGLGGFILGFNARANAVFIQKFMAKLPIGYSFNNAENYMGDHASISWLTPRSGTGKWETYVRAVICGTGTSFGNGGHVYVDGPDTAMEFTLAFAEVYEINSSVFSRIKETFYAKNETIDFNESVDPLITAGAGSWTQRTLLRRGWDGSYGDFIQLKVPGSVGNSASLIIDQNGGLRSNYGYFYSDNLIGAQVLNPQKETLYLGNPSLPHMVLQTNNNVHFDYEGAGRIYTFNIKGVYLDRNINFNLDNSGINFFEGGKIYKKAGGGVYINRGSNGIDPRIENADGSESWMILHEGNYNPFKNLRHVPALEDVVESGIYRQEGPTSGYSFTTTLNLNSSDGRQQLTIERSGGGMKFRGSYYGSGNQGWSDWKDVIHSGNISSYMNSYGFISQSGLNSQLSGYATLAGIQTFTNTNTFTQSPVIPNGTLGSHAVNLNQLNGKANALENAAGIGFSSGNYPSADGSQYPYIYFNNGGTQAYIALATQAYLQSNFLSTPDGTSVMIPGADLNSYFKTGFYRGSGLANAPMNNSGWWYLAVETHDSTWVKQTATSYGSGNTPNITYQRTMVGGRWTAWVQIWTTADFTVYNIQQWNYAYQYGLKLNEEFTVHQNTGLVLADNYFGGESGIIDNQTTRLLAAKRDEYYFYGSAYDNFDGLNFDCKYSLFGMGMPSNGTDKLIVNGSVKALNNFKSDKERPDTLFIPNGETANLRDEIINDESEYAIRLDPHEYEIDQSGYLELNDRNRLIHIIGEHSKDIMVVNLREIYPKQQIVIYNFDHNGNGMEVRIQGNKVYNIESRCFLRLYVTNSLRVIAERLQPCDMIW